MNFQVLWMQQAINSLAQAYLSARDDGAADAVTDAMAEIDRMLQLYPTVAGESRAGTERFLSIGPMAVDYEVFADERVAVVTAARYVRRRGM